MRDSVLFRIGLAFVIPSLLVVAWSLANLDRDPNGGVGGLAKNLVLAGPLLVGALLLVIGIALCIVAFVVPIWRQRAGTRSNRETSSRSAANRSRIVYENGSGEYLKVMPLGQDRYRLEETSVFSECAFHDIIFARSPADGSLVFQSLAEPSGLTRQRFVLTSEVENTEASRRILAEIAAVGGNCEAMPGGLLLVHTRPEFADDIHGRIQSLLEWSDG
jgi:hypothetical protein